MNSNEAIALFYCPRRVQLSRLVPIDDADGPWNMEGPDRCQISEPTPVCLRLQLTRDCHATTTRPCAIACACCAFLWQRTERMQIWFSYRLMLLLLHTWNECPQKRPGRLSAACYYRRLELSTEERPCPEETRSSSRRDVLVPRCGPGVRLLLTAIALSLCQVAFRPTL
jgi:hypothetical protein